MKKIFLGLVVTLVTTTSFSQKNAVKINPLGLIFSSFPITYERKITDKIAFGAEASVMFYKASVGTTADATFLGGGLELKPKFGFGNKEMLRGFYASPVVGYAIANASGKDGSGNSVSGGFSIFNAGAIGGYQWIFGGGDSGFALDVSLGANYLGLSTTGQASGISLSGILPRVGVNLGYAF